ncbi:MogA/MoaB family molybdenum cofactor biosynthesis protein [Oceanispirochaeta sp.]|uniref:MogA/MoaB family molybdenum cofactor biosynthesis protein n=1 Tax=Oceanispirochaeta sp. TaxID=2035350 RepID=UPI0026399CB9|nr:MogA/MoaB family molybdenum cofactor biosynthesis protein [Oceanispirochaeta sp.]MDA3956801.1 MogA/MoaB family molybdenum cofactor biosynthesis protein [Oceanispirochaeta sp.]
MTVTVLTASDRASRGEYEDLSGPEIESIILEAYPECRVNRVIVPDDPDAIRRALEENLGDDYILTTGGTGISPRDVTPEVSREFCDYELPGIAEILRSESYRETPQAMLSRGYAGIKNQTIVVNFPGSVKAVRLCTRVLIPIMNHSGRMLRGEGH